jgi:hypothetical protein
VAVAQVDQQTPQELLERQTLVVLVVVRVIKLFLLKLVEQAIQAL